MRPASFRISHLPSTQYSPRAALDDIGFGVYGQGTVTLRQNDST